MESSSLQVIVGSSDENAAGTMNISSNNAQNLGGGIYVNGASANVILNDGKILDNGTSSYFQMPPGCTRYNKRPRIYRFPHLSARHLA